MKLSEIARPDLRSRLEQGELLIQISPFTARLCSDVSSLADDISLMYGDFTVCPAGSFADFHVEVLRESGLRRWFAPRVYFTFDGKRSFVPLPAGQAFPMLEWGLNWCVAAHAHQYLVMHAAVLERNGRALIMPAPPGSGKSTLCAGLVHRGWRLLSDELALYDMDSGLVYGMARPVNLKNASIEVIKAFELSSQMSRAVPDTAKGTVALMRPPSASVQRALEPALPAWVVLPQFLAGSAASLKKYSKAQSFMVLAEQSFNYDIHGERGFQAVGDLIDRCDCYTFSYSQLSEATQIFDELSQAGAIP